MAGIAIMASGIVVLLLGIITSGRWATAGRTASRLMPESPKVPVAPAAGRYRESAAGAE